MKYQAYVTVMICAFGFMMTATLLSAKTPDGQTPAVETVCDSLKAPGVTKGLYGLCVAFCEAQDADDDFPIRGQSRKRQSAIRILNNYRKKVRVGDPDMPCLSNPCPCWNEQELESVTAFNVDTDKSCATRGMQPSLYSIENRSGSTPGKEGGFATGVDAERGLKFCRKRDSVPAFWLEITDEQFDLCTAHIENRCADIGDPYP